MTATTLIRAGTKARLLTRSLSTTPEPPHPSASLKNITRSNFEPVLAELGRVVRESEFVSIDLEMTGLTSAPWRECFEFDRPDIQYLKVKDSANKFAVVQFGVCPFIWDPNANALVAHPYNFYIFPRQESSEFLCQTSSMEFLAKYNFDFNTCIRQGTSYLSRRQEEEALRMLDNKDGLSDSHSHAAEAANTQLVRMADILFSERMKIEISEWHAGLSRGGANTNGSSNNMNQNFQTTFFEMRPALVMNGFTSRQLRLIKLVTSKNFKDLVYVMGPGKGSSPESLIVYTDSVADRDMLMRDVKVCQKKEAETKIRDAVGFRHVLDLLSSERKLIVGHNCFLDLAHVYNKFFGPLPLTAEEFATSVQKYFPNIIDTKVLLNSNDVLLRKMKRGSTSLSIAFGLLCSQPAAKLTSNSLANTPYVKIEVQVDNQRFSNWNSGAKHEAGYDAFMTGSIFAQSCCHLGMSFDSQALLHDEKLQKYTNQLYLSWVNGDIINFRTGRIAADSLPSTNLKRQNSKISFSNMVLLWGLTPNLRVRDFRDCLIKLFGAGSVTSIYHLDDTAAFLQFSKEHLVSNFLELKYTLERNNDPISVMHPLSKLLENGLVCAASYEMYKEICSSPISEVMFTDQVRSMGITSKTRMVECPGDESTDYLFPLKAELSK